VEETKEKKIFAVYEFGLLLKTMQALLEVGIGAVLYFISTNNIVNFILKIIHGELVEDPNDFFANLILKDVHQFSFSGKHFLIFYLLTHGIVKLIIIVGLLQRKKWAYPVAIFGLGGLIMYQIYHLLINHSIALLIITIIDIIILWLIFHEHKVKKI
jgi:uncharacterized membrane protein